MIEHHTQTHNWLQSSICTCLDISNITGECFTFDFTMFISRCRYVFFYLHTNHMTDHTWIGNAVMLVKYDKIVNCALFKSMYLNDLTMCVYLVTM